MTKMRLENSFLVADKYHVGEQVSQTKESDRSISAARTKEELNLGGIIPEITAIVWPRDNESRCIWTISRFGAFKFALPTSTMFKGILPSRRIPSGDFTIITNLVDDHAKENQYNPSGQTQVTATKGRTGTKGFLQMNEKKKKSDSKKANDSAPKQVSDVPISPQEFDKLLVSCYHHYLSVNSSSSLV